MRAKWKEKTAADKIMLVTRIIGSVTVIICALLQLINVWDKAINVAVPVMGLVLLIQSFQERKVNKTASNIGFVCAAFIFICAIGVWFVK